MARLMDDQASAHLVDAIANDRSRGASELARAALQNLGHLARERPATGTEALRSDLGELARRFIRTRPSMAPMANLLGDWMRWVEGSPPQALDRLRISAAAEAERLIAASLAAQERTSELAATALSGRRILTHSLSSTLLGVFRRLRGSGTKVILTESRPLNEGHLLAARLADWGIPATLITEAQMGLIAQEADLALVGADSLLADGSIVNKAGTLLLALAARQAEIPLYVACEGFKWRKEAQAIQLEVMDPSELGAPTWPGVEIRNQYFDVTPAGLVSGWFTEKGFSRRWPVLVEVTP